MQINWLTAFLDSPRETFESRTRFWSDMTGWSVSPFRGDHNEFATLEPAEGDSLLKVQRLDHGGAGVHIDLHVDDVAAAAAGATALGARVIAPGDHIIMESPAGFVFCFVHSTGYRKPPLLGPDIPHRIDQISIDIPAHRYDVEREFWSNLTSWSGRQSSYEEFFVLDQPDDTPLGLLLQRLGADDGASTARAHIDIAAGEHVARLVRRHEDIGARVAAAFEDWTVLQDPAGYPYCITASDPHRSGA